MFFISVKFLTSAASDSIEYCQETLNYFKQLVKINGDNTGYVKWNNEIRIYLHELNRNNLTASNTVFESDYNELKSEFETIVRELNDCIETVEIKVVEQPYLANFEIFIGSVNDCKLIDPSMRFTLAKNWGVQHSQLSSDGREIVKSSVFIDLYRAPNLRIKKRLLHKKIGQALGFFHEIDETKESIFYSGFSEYKSFTKLDKDLIQLLYNQNVFQKLEHKTEVIDTPKNQISVKVNLFLENAILIISEDLVGREAIVCNSQGQRIHHFQIETKETVISTSEFQSGIYFIRIDNLPAVKIIKQ